MTQPSPTRSWRQVFTWWGPTRPSATPRQAWLTHGIVASITDFYSQHLIHRSDERDGTKGHPGGTPGRAPLGYLNQRLYIRDTDVRNVVVGPHITGAFRAAASSSETNRGTSTLNSTSPQHPRNS
jgi:hypothetical protein